MHAEERVLLSLLGCALVALILFRAIPATSRKVAPVAGPDPRTIVGGSYSPSTIIDGEVLAPYGRAMPYIGGGPVNILPVPITEGMIGQNSVETRAADRQQSYFNGGLLPA